MRENKKGQHAPDMFDFVFVVIGSFLIFLFMSLVLSGGIGQAEKKSLEKVGDFKRLDSAINNLRVQMRSGAEIKVEEVEERIKKSKVLGGKTITNCQDYFEEEDCNRDIIGIHKDKTDRYCRWSKEEKVCRFEMATTQMMGK